MTPTRPRRIVRGEELAEHVAEARELLADDRAGEAAGAQQPRAAEAVGEVVRLQPQVRQRLALRQRQGRLAVLDLACARCTRSVRSPSALRTAASTSGAGPIGGTRRPARAGRSRSPRASDRGSACAAGPPPARQRPRDDQVLAPLRDFRARRRRDRAAATGRRRRAPGCCARAPARGRATAAGRRRARARATRSQ